MALHLILAFRDRPFICTCIYLPCLVLYVLTHICFFPFQELTITFQTILVASWVYRDFEWWVPFCSRTWTLMFDVIYFFFYWVRGELWTCLMPPRVRGILDNTWVLLWVELFRRIVPLLYCWYWVLFLISAYISNSLNCSLCMLMSRLERLVWGFSISPFAGNFLALVPGRYMKSQV